MRVDENVVVAECKCLMGCCVRVGMRTRDRWRERGREGERERGREGERERGRVCEREIGRAGERGGGREEGVFSPEAVLPRQVETDWGRSIWDYTLPESDRNQLLRQVKTCRESSSS